MKHFQLILCLLFVCSCAATNTHQTENVYETAAANLLSSKWSVGPTMSAALSVDERHRGLPDSEWYDAVLRDSGECASTLEQDRAEWLGSIPLPSEMATVQLLECLKTKGWTVTIIKTGTVY